MSNSFILDRREVMLGGVTGLALMSTGIGPAQAATGIRPDIESALGQRMMDLYANGVAKMMDPAINYPPQPQSWTFQAYIHSVPKDIFNAATSGGIKNDAPEMRERVDQIYGYPPAGSPQARWKEAALKCWGSCPHRSPYFTTWHRWYLYYFEGIVRAMSGVSSFMLPYWNYASNVDKSLQIPPQFRCGDSRYHFLQIEDRGLGYRHPQAVANGRLESMEPPTGDDIVALIDVGGYMPFSEINYGPCLTTNLLFPSDDRSVPTDSEDYRALGFSGRVELQPHNNVHDYVGGMMGNVPSSALDPVFYVHHCQIDRLFATWQAYDPVYNYGNPGTATQPNKEEWLTKASWFVDAAGALQQVRLGDCLNTETLGYRYDQYAKPVSQKANPTERRLASGPLTLIPAEVKGPLAVDSGRASFTLAPVQSNALGAPAPVTSTDWELQLSGVTLRQRPPMPLSIYLNLPETARPDITGPFFVATIDLFDFDLNTGKPMVHDMGGMAMTANDKLNYNVTAIIEHQITEGYWNKEKGAKVTIAMANAAMGGSCTYLTFERVSLSSKPS